MEAAGTALPVTGLETPEVGIVIVPAAEVRRNFRLFMS
jgi:hypothetical protein